MNILYRTTGKAPQILGTLLVTLIVSASASWAQIAITPPGLSPQVTIESAPASPDLPVMLGNYALTVVPSNNALNSGAKTNEILLNTRSTESVTSGVSMTLLRGLSGIFPKTVQGDFFVVQGDVVTLTFPANTRAFYFHVASATLDVSDLTIDIDVNQHSAQLADVYISKDERSHIFSAIASNGATISTITITSDKPGIILGGFGYNITN